MSNLKRMVDYNLFQQEMYRLSQIRYTSYVDTMKEIGIGYLGKPNSSAKLAHNGEIHMLTYCLYLASSNASGINVCPKSDMCKHDCLVGSGYARVDTLSGKTNIIDSRITKTRLFFANRDLFMKLMCIEIKRAQNKAKRLGYGFSIRLNGTSDISPLAFRKDGKNILQMYPNVSFYDYTKVKNYWKIANEYPNYHITFSRDGSIENENECLEWLSKGKGHNVAVVFGVTNKNDLPKTWKGYKVIVGDNYDYRPWDLNFDGQIVGLIYKTNGNDYKLGSDGRKHFMGVPKNPFIVDINSKDCGW